MTSRRAGGAILATSTVILATKTLRPIAWIAPPSTKRARRKTNRVGRASKIAFRRTKHPAHITCTARPARSLAIRSTCGARRSTKPRADTRKLQLRSTVAPRRAPSSPSRCRTSGIHQLRTGFLMAEVATSVDWNAIPKAKIVRPMTGRVVGSTKIVARMTKRVGRSTRRAGTIACFARHHAKIGRNTQVPRAEAHVAQSMTHVPRYPDIPRPTGDIGRATCVLRGKRSHFLLNGAFQRAPSPLADLR